MKILVTGGAGFIASHLVDRLIAHGHRVIVVDNLSAGQKENVNPKASFYLTDICDAQALEEVFKRERPEIVNHHAAHVNVRKSVEMPVYDANINILGSLNLCELSKKYQIKKFIYVSTGGAVYGEPKDLPVQETCPVEPLSQYGVSKHTVEHYLSIFYKLYGLNFTVLRYPNVYGPRQSPHGEAGVVAIFSELLLQNKPPTIFGDGSKTRDYVYVEDIVAANLMVLGNVGDGGIYNLGWGKQISDLEVFHTVRKVLESQIEPIFSQKRPGEIDHISLDSSKAKKELNWEPKVTFEEGIRLATEYYKKLQSTK
ncbi:MAG: NAD-dependent epimerase/dehydratase family protein [Planctomycetia bacterium]|nr:NAD-dependent epimerase/dehydratase family protein [Candidatus Brocadia sp.]QOJ06465.1 MAG: NAD-dependent epimerase/dehydratase family protein [Planctomycetia bacterium]TVL95690.1 MAG: UDP-glucose 4-epimerase [Candidatus Brocadia sp. BL1]HQU31320.1 NAD-dependent epimerase/dehydratase family protein [Candidatus Brocadia sapporoensis]